MLKTEISTSVNKQEAKKNTNLGISSMSKTGRVNQQLENGIETTVLLLTKISTLFQLSEEVDTLTILEETLLSRLKMVEPPRNGISINLQEPSDPDQLTSLSTSTTPVNPTTCNTTAPHQDGGKCSSTRTDTSPTTRMVRRSPFPEAKMKKPNQFGYGTNTREDTHLRFGELFTFTNKAIMSILRRVREIHSLASLSENYSSSDQDSQCRELLNVSVQVTLA
jgi:hypothetical protein